MLENKKETDQKAQETTASCCLEGIEETKGGKCPMAEMCEGMMTHSKIAFIFLIPGILFLVGGILILLVPGALVWLAGGTSILLGLVMFAVTGLLRKLGSAANETL